jgi:TonB family protein
MTKKAFSKNFTIVCMVSAMSTVVLLGSQINNVMAKDLPESSQVESDRAYDEEVRARVVKKGMLGFLSGEVFDKNVMYTDMTAINDFNSKIDAILQDLGGLKPVDDNSINRKSVAGIGYSDNYKKEFVTSSGGVEDLVGELVNEDMKSMSLETRKPLDFATHGFVDGAALISGRSRANIMGVIIQNLPGIRYAYGKRFREKSELTGKVTVKFAIDEFGKVIFCSVVTSTIDDPTLEKSIVNKIKKWAFEKINKVGDVTEVVYTFAFS